MIARPNESPYYIGLDRVLEDPYDGVDNPNGVIQLGLSENRVSFSVLFKVRGFMIIFLFCFDIFSSVIVAVF